MKYKIGFVRELVMGLAVFAALAGGGLAREATEFSVTNWYNANDQKLPRVLLIGDSIVKGYESIVRNELAGTAYVTFYATSKSVLDPFYLKELSLILEADNYKVIQFNNGLHSLGDNRVAWEAGLRATLAFLQEKGRGAKIVWATTTPLKDPTGTAQVQELNEIAARVIHENNVSSNDLYALMAPLDRNAYWADRYHATPAGAQMEGHQVADTLRNLLGAKIASAAEAEQALKSASTETGPDGKLVLTPQAANNAILNPRFESTGAPWKVYPPDGRKGTFVYSNEGRIAGQPAAKVTVIEGGLQFYQNKPAFEANGVYTVKFWARAESSLTLAAYARLTAPPYLHWGAQGPFTIDSAWHEYQTTVTLPADYNPDACNFFFELTSPGTCWLADIRVEKK